MASYSAVKSVNKTFTSTTADQVTLTQAWPGIEITNEDTTNDLFLRWDTGADGVVITAVALADNTTRVPAGESKVIAASVNSAGQHVLSLVGDGGAYSVEGVN